MIKRITLFGCMSNGIAVKTQEAAKVAYFTNDNRSIIVQCRADGKHVDLSTKRNVYQLRKHPTQNQYDGMCNGFKTHVKVMKIVAHLSYEE